MSQSADYILALLGIPGVGRVAVSRLTEYFPDPESLLACPREQLVLRLKGVARAADIAEEIESGLQSRMDEAARRIEDLKSHEVEPITPLHPKWPAGLGDLDRADRPVILYSYGSLGALEKPGVALFATPPLSEDAFEAAQTVLRRILHAEGVPVTGAATRFDAAVHRVCSSADHDRPAIFVLPYGLGKLDRSLRALATATVKSGGLLISPFDMEHGPFDHDEFERAAVQAAVSDVSVFIEPSEGSPERRALDWAVSSNRSVFLIGETESVAEAHRIRSDTDLDWLEIAISMAGGDPR